VTQTILVTGNSALTVEIVEHLLESGFNLILATPEDAVVFPAPLAPTSRAPGHIEVLTHARITGCKGTNADFTVFLNVNGELESREVSKIIISEPPEAVTDFSSYGLAPSPATTSLSLLQEKLKNPGDDAPLPAAGATVAFLLGLSRETTPESTRQAMHAAMSLQEIGCQTYILTGNLKVADQGLEQLYRSARTAGVIFIKFTHTRPHLHVDATQQVVIELNDEITDLPFRLHPDLTVLDEAMKPSGYLKQLIGTFDLEKDGLGFAQADNVHRLSVLTNRSGILVAGTARAISTVQEQHLDASASALNILATEHLWPSGSGASAEINPGSCIHCLTCFRICPYRAIEVDTRVHVRAAACEGCGICAAECPRQAIHLPGIGKSDLQKHLSEIIPPPTKTAFTPDLIAFCCGRSAKPASQLAKSLGYTLPAGLKIVEVPCAGSLAVDHLLTVFKHGVDGVMVLTCHQDNCHSTKGNQLAEDRVKRVQAQFETVGFEKTRIRIQTLASNMGAAFADMANDFEKRIIALGPSRL